MARRNDKRERLIDAADKLFHHQGVSNTTLANIAELADVPLGNVYYYFKSKDAIIMAVVDKRKKELDGLFSDWEQIQSIKERLSSFVRHFANLAEEASRFGDALGSLCQELGKQGGSINEASASLMQKLIGWCQNQFVNLGKSDEEANKLALNLVASLQGITLISLTFNDPKYIDQHGNFLSHWLEAL